MNWYKIAKIDYKQPWQMTQEEYINYHLTGYISSTAYESYKTIEGLRWLKKEKHPELYSIKNFNGIEVEFRKSGEKLQYSKQDKNGDIMRDQNGNVIMLTKKEMIDNKLPLEDTSIVAFVGEDAIGWASNEFGATGIWVVDQYQKMGIGSYLLHEFRKSMPQQSRMGQATDSGIALMKSYHYKLVKDAIEKNLPVPQDVLEDYPNLIGKEFDVSYWVKKISKNPYYYTRNPRIGKPCPKELLNLPEIQEAHKTGWINFIKKDPSYYYVAPEEIKKLPEIQNLKI